MEQSLVINITGRQPEPPGEKPCLQLKQGKVPRYAGLTTSSQIAAYMRKLFYGGDGPSTDCGLDDGKFRSLALVYPCVKNLSYNIGITHGTLGESTVSEPEIIEVVNFLPQDRTANLKHPAFEILLAEWQGLGFDDHGNQVLPPPLSVSGTEITVPYGVFGNLKVLYRTLVHGYSVELPKREQAIDNKWSSVVYAWWDGGVKWLDLELPANIDIYGEEDAPCGFGGGGSGHVEWPDPDDPLASKVKRYIDIDYCTQQVIDDREY